MRKQILTDNETKTFLMKTFKCSRQAVYVDGKRTETYQCEFVSDFMQLQHETQQMAAAL